MRRRSFLGALVAASAPLAACGPPPVAPSPSEPPAPPPLHVPSLAGLLPLSGLRWAVFVEPRTIASLPWLIPAIGRIAPEENLARFAASVGFDLRQLPEAIVASYGAGLTASTFYLVRHNADATTIERLFRARLVAETHRSVDRVDVIRVSGNIGSTETTLVVAGTDVAGFQIGGSPSRGPARVASLYALDRLKKSPTILSEPPLRTLVVRLGEAPFRAFAVGPFEGELGRAARGLLASATAVGCAIRPTVREGLLVSIAVLGDFSKSAEAASHELARAWNELAGGSFGHLLGLDEPVQKPIATHAEEAVGVAVEIDPNKLAKGLASATSARLDEIMR